jgi:hypothetical protein
MNEKPAPKEKPGREWPIAKQDVLPLIVGVFFFALTLGLTLFLAFGPPWIDVVFPHHADQATAEAPVQPKPVQGMMPAVAEPEAPEQPEAPEKPGKPER